MPFYGVRGSGRLFVRRCVVSDPVEDLRRRSVVASDGGSPAECRRYDISEEFRQRRRLFLCWISPAAVAAVMVSRFGEFRRRVLLFVGGTSYYNRYILPFRLVPYLVGGLSVRVRFWLSVRPVGVLYGFRRCLILSADDRRRLSDRLRLSMLSAVCQSFRRLSMLPAWRQMIRRRRFRFPCPFDSLITIRITADQRKTTVKSRDQLVHLSRRKILHKKDADLKLSIFQTGDFCFPKSQNEKNRCNRARVRVRSSAFKSRTQTDSG